MSRGEHKTHFDEEVKKRMKWIVAFFVGALCLGRSLSVSADEGMYLPYELHKAPLKELKRRGLKLSPRAIKDLNLAVVQLARGGTGSFVSSKGLIVTNHHVAFRCLVTLDGDTHKGIMDKGYVAKTLKDELPCKNYEMKVVEDLKDVTKDVLKVVRRKMSPAKRFAAIRTKMRALEKRCEKQPGQVCEVRPVNGGVAYTLSRYRRLHDVRLVYAPPKSLGKYGGDKDNWRYPRHTADFAFLRAYVGPNGKSKSYYKKNVPFKPKRFLKVSTSGVRRNDLNMVMGFPGRTMRHSTYYRVAYNRNKLMPFKKTLFEKILAAMPEDDLSKRRYQGLDAGLNNALKYYQDVMKQFDRLKVLPQKKKELVWLKKQIANNPKLRRSHGTLLKKIKKTYKNLRKDFKGVVVTGYLHSFITRSLQVAIDIVKMSRYRRTPDNRIEEERYRKKNRFRVFNGSKMLERTTTLKGERAFLTTMLHIADSLKEGEKPGFIKWFKKWAQKQLASMRRRVKGDGKKMAARFKKKTRTVLKGDVISNGVVLMLGKTRLYGGFGASQKKAVRRRKRLFKASPRKIRKMRDPLLLLAKEAVKDHERYKKGVTFKLNKVLKPLLRPPLIRDVIKPRYLDANFTLRVAFGRVKDYRDSTTNKKWRYVSRLTWLIRRATGKSPFVAPKKLKDVYRRKDFGRWIDPVIKDVPVNFTNTLDTTGGNSGSPVMNGQGKLVGLLFDGTPESMVSDWLYLRKKQRSICVDIRFVLFLAEKVQKAHRVLRELGVTKQ